MPTTTFKWAGIEKRAVLALQELRYIAGARGDPVVSMAGMLDRGASAAATSSTYCPGLAQAAGVSPGGHSGRIEWPLCPCACRCGVQVNLTVLGSLWADSAHS